MNKKILFSVDFVLFVSRSRWLAQPNFHIVPINRIILRSRHEICQNFYTTIVFGQQFYTLKMCKLRLFLLNTDMKRRKFQSQLFWPNILVKLNWNFKMSMVLEAGKVCVKLPNKWVIFIFLRKFCEETHCFLEKTYTTGKIAHDCRARRSWQILSLLRRLKMKHGGQILQTSLHR